LGVSLTTEATIANFFPEVEFRPITGATDVIAFSAVWSLKNDNPVFRRFLSHARVLAKKWSNRSADVTRSPLVSPMMHDSIGRSLVFLALSVQMLGLLT